MNRRLTCINCPLGCALEISPDTLTVSGNACGRGAAYARAECLSPSRMLTTTVGLTGGAVRRLPVKSSAPVPKDLVTDCSGVLGAITVQAPVHTGQIVLADILGTGVDIVATLEIPEQSG